MIQELLELINKIPFSAQIWQIIVSWWWLPLPFILWRPFKFFWKWWRTDLWLAKQKNIILEIRMPKESLKPIRAMEEVMEVLHKVLYKPPDWWEKWIDGEVQPSYAFEIVSIGGETHFFIRFPAQYRDSVEAAVYSQYPEAELSLVEDYTKTVPQDIPNKDWDLWAAEYALIKESLYPIKTYRKFETEHEAKEEKRIDPLAVTLESMAKIKPGEQLWIQVLAEPTTGSKKDGEIPWIKEGQGLKDELARRISKKLVQRPMVLEAADVLITGKVPGPEEKKEELIPPEMKLTPGEREIIIGVEEKIAKPGFKCTARFIYLGKRDVFFRGNLRLGFTYFASFSTENLNSFKPFGKSYLTKVPKRRFLPINILIPRRLYLRKRKIFRKYKERLSPLFPRDVNTARKKGSMIFVLNTEEMATMFHFPSRIVAPAPFVQRIEAKKGEAPSGLPTE